MPKRKKLKKGAARRTTHASAPVDIGNPTQARAETLQWLKGEGPKPEQFFGLLLPDDGEVLDRFREDLWVHPDRATGLGTPGVQLLLDAGEIQKDLLKSRLEPKAKIGNKIIEGGRDGGLIAGKPHRERRKQWDRALRKLYTQRPLTRHTSYHSEAGRLLGISDIEWTDPPQKELLRKSILPSLLRELFPRLYP